MAGLDPAIQPIRHAAERRRGWMARLKGGHDELEKHIDSVLSFI
jgi:hypothetical protein